MSLEIQDIEEARLVAGDTITIRCCQLTTADGQPYDLSDVAVFYCTVKESPSDDDTEALIQIDSATNPLLFDTSNAIYGELYVTLDADDTAGLVPGQNYFIDIKALWADGPVLSIVNASNFQVLAPVTKAVLGGA